MVVCSCFLFQEPRTPPAALALHHLRGPFVIVLGLGAAAAALAFFGLEVRKRRTGGKEKQRVSMMPSEASEKSVNRLWKSVSKIMFGINKKTPPRSLD